MSIKSRLESIPGPGSRVITKKKRAVGAPTAPTKARFVFSVFGITLDTDREIPSILDLSDTKEYDP